MEGNGPPTGTVTFLFTDIEGSTRLWGEQPQAMSASLTVHDEIVRLAVTELGGHVFATGGDSFSVAFARGSAAIQAARTIHDRLAVADWPGPPLTVRIGVHVGEADERDGNYYGPAVNTAARVEAAGHGGQTILTDAVRVAARVTDTTDLGTHRLRDVAEPVRLHQLGGASFPALRTSTGSSPDHQLPESWIVLRQPGRDEETVQLDRELTLGRHVGRQAADGHLALHGDATVSRLHAILVPRAAGWCVQTANPTNGLFVNGVRLAPGAVHLLTDGDVLRLGEQTYLTFHCTDPNDDRSRTEAARPVPELDGEERRLLVALCAPVLSGDAFTPPADAAQIAERLSLEVDDVERRFDVLFERFGIDVSPPDSADDRRLRLAHAALATGAVGATDLRSSNVLPTVGPA